MSERLFKVLGKGGVACHGGKGKWTKGRWRTVKGPLVPCAHGLHLCRERDLVKWLDAEIWEAEYEGERVDAEGKIVVRRARITRKLDTWDERTARLFACDCAEHVLSMFEKAYPDDKRPRQTIEVARRYADGKATWEELDAAWAAAGDAGAAARAAAWAAWAAAGDAERKWQAARLMQYLYPEAQR